jgi:hypothetical protein
MKELIHHTGNYSIIRSDYVQICGGDACTAQVLASFEYWTLCRSQWGHDAWIYTSINDIVDSLCGTFKRNKVIESLKVLKDKGFLESKSSPEPRDQTLLYKFNTEFTQAALDKHFAAGCVV